MSCCKKTKKEYFQGQVTNALADTLNPYIFKMPDGEPAPPGIPVEPDIAEARETLEACAKTLGGIISWDCSTFGK